VQWPESPNPASAYTGLALRCRVALLNVQIVLVRLGIIADVPDEEAREVFHQPPRPYLDTKDLAKKV
jgi:hypothetical protein